MNLNIGTISSLKVKKVNDAINHATITEKELDIMAEFTEKDLSEFFYLINDGVINSDILAYYFVVFNSSLTDTVEKKYEFDFIDKLLATAWLDNMVEINEKEILEMLLTSSIINTNLIKRIRNGLRLNNKTLNIFNNQIESILKLLISYAEKNLFYKTLTSIDINDNEALVVEGSEQINTLKSHILNLFYVFELYDITHGRLTGKEYLSKDKKKLNIYEKELKQSIKDYFGNYKNSLDKFSYLPDHHFELILGIVTETNTKKNSKSVSLDLKGLDALEEISTIERDEDRIEPVLNNKEDQFLGFLENQVNTEQKIGKKTKIEDKVVDTGPLQCRDIILDGDVVKQGSKLSFIFKTIIIFVIIIAVVGWSFNLRSNSESGVEHVKNLTHEEILSYKLSSGSDGKYDMKINRSGIKENGTVNAISTDIQ